MWPTCTDRPQLTTHQFLRRRLPFYRKDQLLLRLLGPWLCQASKGDFFFAPGAVFSYQLKQILRFILLNLKCSNQILAQIAECLGWNLVKLLWKSLYLLLISLVQRNIFYLAQKLFISSSFWVLRAGINTYFTVLSLFCWFRHFLVIFYPKIRKKVF